MNESEKEKLRQSLINWLEAVDDEDALSKVQEVQAEYGVEEGFSPDQIAYINKMLEESEKDIEAGRVIGLNELQELFKKWRTEAS